jgi:type II secretory pathway pseudopilin PulG
MRGTNMVFNLKGKRGSTIVEVLVSVIIIGIVSVYGLSFFSSAYKHSVDSKDYSFVLHDLVRKMEMVKGGGYPSATNGNYYPFSTISEDGTRFDFKRDKELREGCTVRYTCEADVDTDGSHNFSNSARITLRAEWPIDNPDFAPGDRNTITLVTYIAAPRDNNIERF